MHYRRDIDGLRALAVIPVLLFHVGLSTGGFVGVDVFFVISGFLITSLIVQEQGRGAFSVVRFYERRVRRIMPALFGLLLFFLILSLFALAPADRANLARTSLFALFSVSNIHFSGASGYFERSAHTEPLLHTWSLGVEEQFYLIFPVLVLGLSAARISLPAAFRLLLLASLAVSSVGALLHQPSAFYLLPSRAWELLLGALLATGGVPQIRTALTREVVSGAGLVLIVGSVLLINPGMPFPGLVALAPCLGAAALIHAGASGTTWASRLLSLGPFVGIGLISYSLYLWHWPILSFQKMAWTFFPFDSRYGAGIVVVALSFLASYLSWRFIEKPFRGKSMSARWVLVWVGAAAALIIAVSASMVLTSGLPGVLPNQAGPYAGYMGYDAGGYTRRGSCFLWKRRESELDKAACLTPAADRRNVLIIGDSHAAHLWLGLKDAYPEHRILQATAAACKPLPVQVDESYPRCDALMTMLYDRFLPGHQVDTVILMGNWKARDTDQVAAAALRLKRQGINVVWMGPIVRYDQDLPRLLTLAWRRGDPSILDRHRLPLAFQLDARMAARAREDGISYVSLTGALCPGGVCRTTTVDGAPMQYDGAHLTAEGSRDLAATLRRMGFLDRPPAP